jgi:cell pole-organizing protein PopZ
MEDILASIRRILSEDDPASAPAEAKPAAAEPAAQHPENPSNDDVLLLDASMLVPEQPSEREDRVEMPPPPAVVPSASLVAPEAAAAAASSVGSLVRTLAAERTTQVRSGGPTIEDIVREEIRPLLKHWLDTNLPPLVERLVRAEIERVVGRAVP